MHYKKVDKIQEKISSIGLGCWNFGGDWDSAEDENSKRIILESIYLGINFFDVAPVYGWGHSEEILGKTLKESGQRNKVIIASKGGLLWDEKRETRNNLTKQSLLEEIDASLMRLQTDYIDIYQMHWPDHSTPLEETAEALEAMKKAGKIRYVGLSNYSISDVEKMMEYTEVHCQQSLYNMLERNTTSYHKIPLEYKTEKEVLPFVKKHGQAFLPYSPLFQGLLAGKFTSGKNFSENDIRNANPKLVGKDFELYFKAANDIKNLALEYNKPMNELALNWLRQKPEVTSIIGGASTVEQLKKNLQCLEWEINEDMMGKINLILAPFENL